MEHVLMISGVDCHCIEDGKEDCSCAVGDWGACICKICRKVEGELFEIKECPGKPIGKFSLDKFKASFEDESSFHIYSSLAWVKKCMGGHVYKDYETNGYIMYSGNGEIFLCYENWIEFYE